MNTLNQNQHGDHPGMTGQNHDPQNARPGASKTKDDVPPPETAGGSGDFEGVPEASNLYPEYLPPLNDYGEHLSR